MLTKALMEPGQSAQAVLPPGEDHTVATMEGASQHGAKISLPTISGLFPWDVGEDYALNSTTIEQQRSRHAMISVPDDIPAPELEQMRQMRIAWRFRF